MSNILKFLFPLIFFFVFVPFIQAANSLNVVLNEICWMGTKDGWYFEWIELKNNTEKEIDLSGWKIENASFKGKPLEISGKILPKSYFLICKKEIGNCDFLSWNLSLNNNYGKNGRLILKNKENKIVDQTPEPLNSEWPAGDERERKTMERKNPEFKGSDLNNWQTSENPGGTPKIKNSPGSQIAVKKDSKKEKVFESKESLAAIGKEFPRSLIVFSIALFIAIFSVVIFLILKKKIESKNF